MGDDAGKLQTKLEPVRTALPPFFDGLQTGQTVESRITLDGVEDLTVVVQPLIFCASLRVDSAPPVVAVPNWAT